MAERFANQPDGSRYPFVFDVLAPYVAKNPSGNYNYVYFPADPSFKFGADPDGDGKPDTMSQYSPYSHGRPTVHNGGAKVGLLDGHVEKISFKKLWDVNAAGNVTHPFWWLDP